MPPTWAWAYEGHSIIKFETTIVFQEITPCLIFFLGYKCGIEAESSYLLISWKPGMKETELTFYVYFIMLSVHQGLCILYLSGSVIKYI